MNIINGILGIVLISLFIVMVYAQLKKIERKINGVRNGTLHDKRLITWVEKAQRSSKIKYTLYLPITYSVLASLVFIIILYPIDLLMDEKGISVYQFSFLFIFMSIAISAWQVILARKTWTLCHGLEMK